MEGEETNMEDDNDDKDGGDHGTLLVQVDIQVPLDV